MPFFFTACRVRDAGFFLTGPCLLPLLLLLPDLNRKQVPAGSGGPHLQAPDRSGHCHTSTASSRSQWALPDSNSKLATASSDCQLPCQIECQKECQIDGQNTCQIECQNICHMSGGMPQYMPDMMLKRMSEYDI